MNRCGEAKSTTVVIAVSSDLREGAPEITISMCTTPGIERGRDDDRMKLSPFLVGALEANTPFCTICIGYFSLLRDPQFIFNLMDGARFLQYL